MQILPVIDLMNGHVVRGVAGRRAEYKPIVSRLTSSIEPIDVALAFREHFGLSELYLADLDALAGNPPALATYAALHHHGFRLWVDAGLKNAADAGPLLEQGVDSIIAGLETIESADALEGLLARVTPARLVFSLDLKAGQPLTHNAAWLDNLPLLIAEHVVNRGVRRLIVLDLAQVGVGAGVGSEGLCRQLRACFPSLELTAGGGVRDLNDVETMRRADVNWLLIASALHDGRLTSANLGRGCAPVQCNPMGIAKC